MPTSSFAVASTFASDVTDTPSGMPMKFWCTSRPTLTEGVTFTSPETPGMDTPRVREFERVTLPPKSAGVSLTPAMAG